MEDAPGLGRFVAAAVGPVARIELALITTASAALGSIPSLLRDNDVRDPDKALKQLVALAATAPSQALKAPVQVFNALRPFSRSSS